MDQSESKQRDVLIWGAGNVGEVVAYILSYDSHAQVRAFLDDSPTSRGKTINGVPILAPDSETLQGLARDGVTHGIVAIGNGRIREKLSQRLEEFGYAITTAIHPSAQISPEVQLGKGAIIASCVNLFYNPVIGNYVFMAPSVTVTHDSSIEDNAELCAGCLVGARVTVKKNAYIGIGALLVPKDFGHISVGEDAMVGTGSLVLEDVPPRAVVVGSPARIIRYKSESD